VSAAIVVLAGCGWHSASRYAANGDRYMAAGRYAEASIEYRNAVRLSPESAALERKLGDAYAALHASVGASIAYERACSLQRSHLATAPKAGDAHLAFDDINPALALAHEILQDAPSSADAHLLLARALDAAGDLVQAEQEVRTAIALAPRDARLYTLLGDLQRRTGERTQAEASLVKAAELSRNKSAKARVALAGLYLETGRSDEGERQLRAALDESPEDPDANRAYASLLVATDRCEDAEPYWLKVAAKSADDSGTLSLADYYVFSGRPDDALRVLTPLLRGRDEGGGAALRVASIYLDRGNWQAARRLIQQVLARQPDNDTALTLKDRIQPAAGPTQ